MRNSLVAAMSLAFLGCATPQWKDASGNPPSSRDRLECETEGLKASGAGTAGVWNQVQVENNCLRLRGYDLSR